jgi:chromosome segregation ATPase
LEQKLAAAPAAAANPAETQDPEGLYRRYEMALCDLRELKARNAELQKHLDQLGSERSQGRPGGSGHVMDWESEKRRILAALESPAAGGSPKDRPRIEELVEKTERLLAEKDRQIAELRELAQRPAAAADPREAILDQDAVIREERENLRRLEEECREKSRRAEVELSIERANLARREAETEEKLRTLAAGVAAAGASDASPAGEKSPRGRWLSRLGLAGDDPPAR